MAPLPHYRFIFLLPDFRPAIDRDQLVGAALKKHYGAAVPVNRQRAATERPPKAASRGTRILLFIRSVARTAPATIWAAGSDIAGPAVRARALARNLFDDRRGVLHERMNARSDRRLSVRRHVDRNQDGCRRSQSHREFSHETSDLLR